MRAIILVQSIIILLGAYYIYTMSHTTTVQTSPVVEVLPATTTGQTIREGYVPPTTQPPSIEEETTATTSVTGPSDAGMEYPIAN